MVNTVENRSCIIYVFLMLGLFASCNKSIDSKEELFAFINNEENGFVKSKQINSLTLKVKYLPLEYLVAQNADNAQERLAAVKDYSDSYTFILTIAGKDDEAGLFYYDVNNKQDFEERFKALNFGISEYITLRVDGKEYRPILHNVENTYELTKKQNVHLVFSEIPEFEHAEKIDFIFEDRFFDTGISHFVFDKKDLDQLPPVKL